VDRLSGAAAIASHSSGNVRAPLTRMRSVILFLLSWLPRVIAWRLAANTSPAHMTNRYQLCRVVGSRILRLAMDMSSVYDAFA